MAHVSAVLGKCTADAEEIREINFMLGHISIHSVDFIKLKQPGSPWVAQLLSNPVEFTVK